MAYKVHVRTPAGATLTIAPENTILEAALAAGIVYPHGCKIGRCGACKSRLVRGQVELLKHTPFALTEDEKRAGLILACRAQPRSACDVAWIEGENTEHPIRHERALVTSIEDATHDIKVVRLELDPGAPMAFSAGQYAELTFPGCPPRHYSMANKPGDGTLEFHVRRVPGGISSGFAASRLTVGQRVGLRGPFGVAHLRTGHTGPIVAVAGGSGLAPITSIVETALAHGMRQPIRVYFGARAERDIYGEARFRRLTEMHPNLSFTPVLSHEAQDGRRHGLVTQALGEDCPEARGWKAYIAGPPPMVDAASEILIASGLATADLHADAFFTTAEQADAFRNLELAR